MSGETVKLSGETSHIFLFFTLKIGETIQFEEHIFSNGW